MLLSRCEQFYAVQMYSGSVRRVSQVDIAQIWLQPKMKTHSNVQVIFSLRHGANIVLMKPQSKTPEMNPGPRLVAIVMLHVYSSLTLHCGVADWRHP